MLNGNDRELLASEQPDRSVDGLDSLFEGLSRNLIKIKEGSLNVYH